MKPFGIAIFGPTGVGKTSLALELAQNNGEIISVDSMQVYKYLEIGTAKPSKDEIAKVKHHLIDVITPDAVFAAGEFVRRAKKAIFDICNNNKVPYLVGGTGLYFTSLIRGMIDIPKIDSEVRNKIISDWDKLGQKAMYNKLISIDFEYSKKIHANDKQRTLRGLEVFYGTGKKFSDFLKTENIKNEINYIKIGINIDRDELYKIINNRVDIMVKKGLFEEVDELVKKGYSSSDPGMRAIGYKEIFEYRNDNISKNECIEKIKKNSRRYAKRQLTWFKKLDNVKWFSNTEIKPIKDYIAEQKEIIFS